MHLSTGTRRVAPPTHACCGLGASRFGGALCDVCLCTMARVPPLLLHVAATAWCAQPTSYCHWYRPYYCCCPCSGRCRHYPCWMYSIHQRTLYSKHAQSRARQACKITNPVGHIVSPGGGRGASVRIAKRCHGRGWYGHVGCASII